MYKNICIQQSTTTESRKVTQKHAHRLTVRSGRTYTANSVDVNWVTVQKS